MKQTTIKESLGYLLAQACKTHRGKANEKLAEIGLYTGQEIILTLLKEEDNIPQNTLVRQIGVQPATMTKVLQRLEKGGYVKKERDKDDKRITKISLTSKGNEIQNSILKVWGNLEKITFETFSEEEKIIFKRLLLQIVQNLENN